ncbi:type II toxin-antitoxin system HicA family toxin [Marinospirillum sp.]|uniref:type II toxin-antitoxin system HicA family toxin n=1 Tax=Marinospirillum sp. TaxID=2183934 RepID=UPI00384FDE83
MGASLYPDLVKILLAYQCSFVRQGKGSHEIWQSPITHRKFPVATTIVSKNTANAILKQAGIEERL